MIISLEKIRKLVPQLVGMSDEELEARLDALESLVRKYTNNTFRDRKSIREGAIRDGALDFDATGYKIGDTIEISCSYYNDGLYVYGDDTVYTDESGFSVHKVVYPPDVVMGVVNLVKWDISNREKVGVKSETISRWSVTYYDLDANATMGFPKSLLGFLKPYMRAQF